MPKHAQSTPRRRRGWRRARKRITAGAISAALRCAPWAPDWALDAGSLMLERLLPRFGPLTPGLASIVRRNMLAAGVHRVGAESQYFRQVARHLASAMYFFKAAGDRRDANGTSPAEDRIRVLAHRHIEVDDSIRHHEAARRLDRGVILAPAHCCQFLLSLTCIGEHVPLTVYLRYSRNAAGRDHKATWCRAAGLDMIAEPSRIADPAARAAVLATALRERNVLVITPDIAQRRGKGVPVRLLGREMALASGVAALALLTGAPVVPLLQHPRGNRNCCVFHEALVVPDIPRRRGWRSDGMRILMQQWADRFADFLRSDPDQWWLWLDNRWTRVWGNDPKYARPVAPPT